ncbi:MAG: AbfB domain-containing protein [Methanosarcinaceae archaeon]|nr:AbfB domain-containing protein [Methanosarcinaceae archaeon]
MIRLVRPNLGMPLILEPNELERFEITVAYQKEWIQGKEENENDVHYPSSSEIAETLRKNPPHIIWNNVDIPLTIHRVYGYFRHREYKENYNNVVHAETNQDQQYRNGFRWEATVEVGISEQSIKTLKDQFGWPILLNLDLSGRKNYHAIYVHETLKKSDKFTILHITDTHIAKRNDLIPDILCEVRNREECQKLKERYINPNDNLRAFISVVNKRLEKENVIVILTGDIVDFYFDGYWDGHFVCGQGGHAPDMRRQAAGASWKSNVEKFHEIITGRDNKGEALKCPIFTILGNHDYRANEVLLNWNAKLSLLGIKLYKRHDYSSFGLLDNEGIEYDFWAFPRFAGKYHNLPYIPHQDIQGNTTSIAPRKTFKEFQTTKWKASLNQDWAYWLIKPKSWILSQYLCTVNYDIDFSFQLGNSSFLCLNTAYDRYPKQEELAMEGMNLAQYPRWITDFVNGGPHSRGITNEHLKLLKNALEIQKEKLIFIFTHAPLISLPKEKGISRDYLYYESNHENSSRPPNRLSNFLAYILPAPLFPENRAEPELDRKYKTIQWLNHQGFPLTKTKYFKHGNRYPYLTFNCSDGMVNELLKSITHLKNQQTNNPVLVLSGHTHQAHEFRIEKDQRSKLYYFTDEYSKKIFMHIDMDKKLNIAEILMVGSRYEWLKKHSPLLLTSGAVKNQEPQYREIVVRGQNLASLEMKSIKYEDIQKTANYTPGCRLIALRSQNGQYVCNPSGYNLVARCNQSGLWKNFELIQLEHGKVAIRAYNRLYVSENGGKLTANSTKIDASSTFSLIGREVNQVALRAHNGKYVCAEGGGGKELVVNRSSIGSWETFTLIEIETSGQVALQSFNYPNYFIRHRNFIGGMSLIKTELDKKDATFRIVSGLLESELPFERYISIQSVNYPGHYLRHQNFILKLHPYIDDELFRKDASFKLVSGLGANTWSSFESVNYPDYHIRHKNFKLYLGRGNDDLFKKDATFKVASPNW